MCDVRAVTAREASIIWTLMQTPMEAGNGMKDLLMKLVRAGLSENPGICPDKRFESLKERKINANTLEGIEGTGESWLARNKTSHIVHACSCHISLY